MELAVAFAEREKGFSPFSENYFPSASNSYEIGLLCWKKWFDSLLSTIKYNISNATSSASSVQEVPFSHGSLLNININARKHMNEYISMERTTVKWRCEVLKIPSPIEPKSWGHVWERNETKSLWRTHFYMNVLKFTKSY